MERFRIGLLILIVFLVITLGLDFPNLCPIHQFALDLNEDESRPQSQLAQNPIGLSFTWTSASISEPQEVNNNSVIIGDHIVVNATFENEILGMNITGSELIFRDELENTNQTRVNNNAITVDTYYLNRMNNTYEISVIGYTIQTNPSHMFGKISLCATSLLRYSRCTHRWSYLRIIAL